MFLCKFCNFIILEPLQLQFATIELLLRLKIVTEVSFEKMTLAISMQNIGLLWQTAILLLYPIGSLQVSSRFGHF